MDYCLWTLAYELMGVNLPVVSAYIDCISNLSCNIDCSLLRTLQNASISWEQAILSPKVRPRHAERLLKHWLEQSDEI